MERVIIFGIGDNFVSQRAWIRENFEIIALVDNSAAKHGIIIDGIQVATLEEALEHEFDLVIVTPMDSEFLVKQLLHAGIPKEKVALLTELVPGVGADRLRVAFLVFGSSGDRLFALNYIWYFKEKYMLEGDILDIIYGEDTESCIKKQYQLIIKIVRYPEIKKVNMPSLARLSPELLEYVQQCQKFRLLNERYFEDGFEYIGQASVSEILKGRKRIQQPDIYGLLGIGERFNYPISVGSTEAECLNRFGVAGRDFITFSKDAKQAVKAWSAECFNRVLEWFAGEYPKLLVIELSDDMDLEDRKVLLKKSILHIDTDSDNVHLRHALHGNVSIVLFGPTPVSVYGYSGNYNITGKGCEHFCEGAADGWEKRCLAGGAIPLCMETITVEMVERYISEILGEYK